MILIWTQRSLCLCYDMDSQKELLLNAEEKTSFFLSLLMFHVPQIVLNNAHFSFKSVL